MSYFIPPHVRSIRSEGGVVLLSLTSGAYFTLNAVGVLVFEQLQHGSTREAALAALGRRFPVPEERLARDIDMLLERLIEKGLLCRGAAAPQVGPRRLASEHGQAVTATATATATGSAPWPSRVFWTTLAYLTLVGMDVLIQIAGFARFHRVVSGWRTRARSAVDPGDAARVVSAVDTASAFYFKRAWCLQRSATTACLLRLRGFPAELIIGVRRVPFMAHAWVQVGGHVVNDSDRVLAFHEIIERC